VIVRDDGMSDFRALRSKRRPDLRDLPLIERKRRLAKLLGEAKRYSVRFTEHLSGGSLRSIDST
jgi:hypothetical protein